jgi:hypothetical protein
MPTRARPSEHMSVDGAGACEPFGPCLIPPWGLKSRIASLIEIPLSLQPSRDRKKPEEPPSCS